MVKVSLVKGEKRKNTVIKSLDLISEDIKKGLKPGKVIIKPNFVSTSVQLASSHADQIRGILDYFKAFYDEKIIIAEAASPFSGGTAEGFENFGYHQLTEEYNVELLDLNEKVGSCLHNLQIKLTMNSSNSVSKLATSFQCFTKTMACQ